MILVYCEANVAPEKQEEFLAKVKASGAIEATNREPGNISYELSASVETPGKLYFIERWESRRALPAHMRSKNYLTIRRISEEYGVTNAATVYSAEEWEKPKAK